MVTEGPALGHSAAVEAQAQTMPVVAAPVGSAEAAPFEALYDTHVDGLWRTLARLGVEPMHVEDAAQEVFITAWKRRGEFRGGSSARTWLIGIAVKIASHHRRATKRRDAREAKDAGPSALPLPDEALHRAQGLARLQRVLDLLTEQQREVFVMIEMEGLSAPEASTVLGVGTNTIYSRLRLARAAFDAAVERLEERSP